jgi:hypothetical protein
MVAAVVPNQSCETLLCAALIEANNDMSNFYRRWHERHCLDKGKKTTLLERGLRYNQSVAGSDLSSVAVQNMITNAAHG